MEVKQELEVGTIKKEDDDMEDSFSPQNGSSFLDESIGEDNLEVLIIPIPPPAKKKLLFFLLKVRSILIYNVFILG